MEQAGEHSVLTRVGAWRESVASNQASVAAAKRAWQPNVLATGHGCGGISRSSPPSVRSPTAHGLISPTRSRCCRSGKASHLPYPLLNDRVFASERLLQAAREMGDVPYDARIR